MTSRRKFLAAFAAGIAGTALAETIDLDKLLWEKGEKVYVDLCPVTVDDEHGVSYELRRGDVVTIEGRFAKNPVTGLYLPFPQHFVVTADVSVGARSVPLWPKPDAPFQPDWVTPLGRHTATSTPAGRVTASDLREDDLRKMVGIQDWYVDTNLVTHPVGQQSGKAIAMRNRL